MVDRREFLGALAAVAAGARVWPWRSEVFQISLAEWSLHKTLFAGKLTNLEFPVVARTTYGIDAVEYVNQFFKDKAEDATYLRDLKSRADANGVKSLLIMCDGEGELGDPDPAARTRAVENHYRWVTAATSLGCHSIRVNAQSRGSPDEQRRLAADGLRRLTEFAARHELNVIVENHGGLSSNGAWLAGVMKAVDHPRCGTLPDFGNFQVAENDWYDRYKGVAELMPFAKAVSAKSHDFDAAGNETRTDYRRIMRIVLDAGYRGSVGIEYEGDRLSEEDGIRATKGLLERVRTELTPSYTH
ncbi:MAG TPA: sugar phosphate isomerase/epimerase family protein [Gemmatimonadales bacterium]|nr:sugar phosphate isomerase/epimerase family protein [Gemmatimonadales bacterium]